jgi:DNA repair protein RecO (recombination protein O)
MGPSQSSEAVVLRARAYGESDKIVTFLTDNAGKLTGIAKGAKNSRRRFANCLEPFTQVRVHYRTRLGATLVFMESCDLLVPTGALVEPTKFAYGSYLVELVDQLTAEAHSVPDIYTLLAEALDELRRRTATAAFLRVFELRLLHHAGYAPQLTACSRCRRSAGGAGHAFLDPAHGSIICASCHADDSSLIPVAGQTLAVLDAIKTTPLAEASRHPFGAATATEAAQIMGHLLAQHLPRPLRSVRLIAALGRRAENGTVSD